MMPNLSVIGRFKLISFKFYLAQVKIPLDFVLTLSLVCGRVIDTFISSEEKNGEIPETWLSLFFWMLVSNSSGDSEVIEKQNAGKLFMKIWGIREKNAYFDG